MISIVVPVFNEEPALLQRSLQSLVEQTCPDFECLIVDESTREDTLAVSAALAARDPRFLHKRPDKRLGLAASLNWGIEMASHELLARFDADDICEPERLAQQSQFLNAHPDVGVLGTGLSIIDQQGQVVRRRDYPQTHEQIASRMQLTTAVAHPTVMMRRSLLRAAGSYRTDFRYAEDLELWLRLLKRGVRFANLPGHLVRYRQTEFTRSSLHWRSNLRARWINLAPTQIGMRALGLASVAVFCIVPPAWQQALYRRLVLSRAQATSTPQP